MCHRGSTKPSIKTSGVASGKTAATLQALKKESSQTESYVYAYPCLETDTHTHTHASTPAYDHSGPAWSYRPFAKRPFHPLREQDRSDDGRTASESADLPAREGPAPSMLCIMPLLSMNLRTDLYDLAEEGRAGQEEARKKVGSRPGRHLGSHAAAWSGQPCGQGSHVARLPCGQALRQSGSQIIRQTGSHLRGERAEEPGSKGAKGARDPGSQGCLRASEPGARERGTREPGATCV